MIGWPSWRIPDLAIERNSAVGRFSSSPFHTPTVGQSAGEHAAETLAVILANSLPCDVQSLLVLRSPLDHVMLVISVLALLSTVLRTRPFAAPRNASSSQATREDALTATCHPWA